MPSQGRYFRNIYNERKRYAGALAQRSETGRPAYLVDSDFRDWSDIMMRGLQRLAQTIHPTGAVINESFGIVEVPAALGAGVQDNNFYILGRRDSALADNPTGEYAAAGYLGGLRISLFQSTDFQCTADLGVFDTSRADGIHRKFTAAEAGYIEDHRARYRTNALVGLYVRTNEGTFQVVSNTANRIVLAGYPAANVPTQDGDCFYFVHLRTAAVDEVLDVYLDVHLEDWGANEDLALNHNPGGSTLEGMRRWKIVQQVFINYPDAGTGEPSQPITDHVDHGGTQHYVMKLGEVTRVAGVAPVVDGDIENVVDRNAGVGVEVANARDFANLCVADADQPVNLSERLAREHSWTTVGVAGNEGVHNDPAGLEDALACADIHTIYLKAGIYNFTSALTISAGKHIYAEPGVSIVAQDVVTVEANVQLHNAYFSLSGGGAFVLVTGANVLFDGVSIVDLVTNSAVHALNLSAGAFQFHAVNSRIYTRTRPGVSIVTQAGASPSSVRQAGATVNIPPAALFVRSVVSADQIGGDLAAVFVDSGMQTVFDDCSLVSSARIIDSKLTGQSASYTSAASTLDNVIVENCHLIRIGRDAGSSAAAVRFSRSFFSFRGNTLVFEAESGAVAPVYPAISVEVEDIAGFSGRGTIEDNVLLVKGIGVYYESTVTFSKLTIANNVFTALDTSPTQAIALAAGGSQNNIDVDGNLISFQNAVLADGILIADTGVINLRNNVIYGAKNGVRVSGFNGKLHLDKCKFFLCTTGYRQEAGAATDVSRISHCAFDQCAQGLNCNTGRAIADGCDFISNLTGVIGAVTLVGGRVAACGTGYSGNHDISEVTFTDCDTGVHLTGFGYSPRISGCAFLDYANTGIDDDIGASIFDCSFDAVSPALAVSPNSDTRISRSKFKGSSGNFSTGYGRYTDCAFEATNDSGTPLFTVGPSDLVLVDCDLNNYNFIVAYAAAAFGGTKGFHIEGCNLEGIRQNAFAVENPRFVYFVGNRIDSVTNEAKTAFDPLNRPLYIYGTTVDDGFCIANNYFRGSGIAVDLQAQNDVGPCISNNTFADVSGGIFLHAGKFLIDQNNIFLNEGSASATKEPRVASAIWVGPNTASLDRTDVTTNNLWNAVGVECADVVVTRNMIHGAPTGFNATNIIGIDTVDASARPAAIMVAGNNALVEGNTIFSAAVPAWSCAIMLGNIAEAKVSAVDSNRHGVEGGQVLRNTIEQGFIVTVMHKNRTYGIHNNIFKFLTTAAPHLVLGFRRDGSADANSDAAVDVSVIRFTGNEAYQTEKGDYDVERSHDPVSWGLIAVTRPIGMDFGSGATTGLVAVEPGRWRADSDPLQHQRPRTLVNADPGVEGAEGAVDLWKLLNNFNLGADLEL